MAQGWDGAVGGDLPGATAGLLHAIRALSEEIDADVLLNTILRVTLDYAGAGRALLLCMEGDAALIKASATRDAGGLRVTLRSGLAREKDLPLSLMHRVLATRAPADTFASGEAPDPYFDGMSRCACVCIPMCRRADLVGLLYLENRHAVAPFAEQQTAALLLLGAQAAVSLETARHYRELLEENAERRRIEQALRASQATLVLGEQISQSGSWSWQPGADSMHCSAQFCRMFGLGATSAVVRFEDFLTRVHADDRERVRQQSSEAACAGLPILIDFRVPDDDGAVRYISAAGRALATLGVNQGAEEDSQPAYVGTAIDVSIRRAAEDTLRQAQAELARVARVTTVGQLAASIAHEVNQPLMSISANAGASLRWLERSPPNIDEARAGLADIAEQSQRAGAIIGALQALTRKAPPRLAAVDLHQTVRAILDISRAELERHNIALEIALMAVSGMVLGDAVQLQQLLRNIVINAIEAMADVRGRSRVLAICSWSTDSARIAVRVDDAGMGLRADTGADAPGGAEIVFEPFYTTKPHGMGMGLAICRSIVTAHHGTVSAMPRQPHGCSVVFYLPELSGAGGRA